MKKVFSVVIVFILLLSIMPTAFAAGSASLSGPSVVRAGDTITLTFSAGGGIYGGSGSVSYDTSQLTLLGYTATIGGSWAVEFNGNQFVFYDNNMSNPINGSSAIFQAKFTVNSSLETGANLSVTVSNITLSDGKQDMPQGSRAYSAVIAPPLSGDCNLASLTVGNAALTPGFSPATTRYTVSVPYTVSSLSVTAAAAHPGAKVSVSNPQLIPGGTTSVTVTVTAENGAVKTYTILAARAQDPNYVESSNANLASLSAEGWQLSPAFSVDVLQYYLWLPYEAETVTLDASPEDPKASAVVGSVDALIPGGTTDIPVTVTAEDGTEQIYTVTVFRAPAHADVDKFLKGEPEPTEPPTEPATEPTTAPTTKPTEPPTTAPPPATVPQETPAESSTPSPVLCILWCFTGILLGAAAGCLLTVLTYKKRT